MTGCCTVAKHLLAFPFRYEFDIQSKTFGYGTVGNDILSGIQTLERVWKGLCAVLY